MAGLGLLQVVDGLHINKSSATSDDHETPVMPLGATVFLDDGRAYRYYQNSQASVIGQIVTPLFSIVDADVDAAASDASLTGTGDFTANQWQYGQAYVFVNSGTGIGQYRRVVANSANVLYLDSAWSTALDTTSDYVLYAPFRVELCDATMERVVGVALGANTADYFNWYQVGGHAGVRVAGNTDAIVAHEGVMSSGTEGVAKGLTASPTAEEADRAFGYATLASGAADAAGQLVPIMLNRIL